MCTHSPVEAQRSLAGVNFKTRLTVAAPAYTDHAENKLVGRIIPFLGLGFWDNNTVIAPVPCHIAGIVEVGGGAKYV